MNDETTLKAVIAAFGSSAKAKLSNPSVIGEPEDQLRAPFEQLLGDIAVLAGFHNKAVIAVGETSISELKTRPDYSITVQNALVGFVELKAPGKGADPRKFKEQHDKEQWEKLQSLPNLIYTDGNSFSLWQDGKLVDSIVNLDGDIETSGNKLQADSKLLDIFEKFFLWEPISPRNAKELARVSARLCRLLRDEVTEQLALQSEALTTLATDWRKLLFPDATNERFADGYAQAVTFGLLMARAKGIDLATGLGTVAEALMPTSSLIGSALKLLTDNAENQATLKTSLGTLARVLDAVEWTKISKGNPETWLYFYEDFLEVYDNTLRKKTGSYYTPPEVVSAMVNLVDETLRSPRFGQSSGLAAQTVTLADPATGTGTYMLGVLRKIAETIEEDEGKGAVSEAVNSALKRLIAFEIQLGPFAVAQLRILAELVAITGAPPKTPIRMFVTDTLGNPDDDEGWIPSMLAPIAQSRKEANKIKREEPITVVLGNPPYKVKAKGLGGWVEGENKKAEKSAPLAKWMPPSEWGLGAHSKHLRNLYVYFWRWATWKVFDHHDKHNTGIVCFITVAGFLSGPGFEKMRDYLRRTCDDIWVIDCSPEGHQPPVNSRIFQDVQQPICIVLASRSSSKIEDSPAKVHYRTLPAGHRKGKFLALSKISIADKAWVDCSSEWRSPFLPASTDSWAAYPSLEKLFIYNGSGVMPGRTWIIAPDADSLNRRWQRLIHADEDDKETLFHPHFRGGKLGDKHSKKTVLEPLFGHETRSMSVADDSGECLHPVRYGYRSFDRQWIIPDSRVINQSNPDLWAKHSERQVYLTAFTKASPKSGPAITFTGLIPDLHHYKGSFGGRVFPLWSDAAASISNINPKTLSFLSKKYGAKISPEDFVAYIAAIAAHPAYIQRFNKNLLTPGIRIPFTAKADVFFEVSDLGRTVIWLHTFGERMADPAKGRPARPPRLTKQRPTIAQEPNELPDSLIYDSNKKRLLIGTGYVDNVEPKVWHYEISGKQVLLQWFSYRKANRERPMIGDRRTPSPLGDIQPDHWLAEYNTELINVLNVLSMLVELEPKQALLLEKVCTGPVLSTEEFRKEGLFDSVKKSKTKGKEKRDSHPDFFEGAK